ncbi:hypothetical protein BDV39DRAFT_193889 [Aspergillus sergii]|uniref:C2H2-type domain-containing protein n=1 Tax=Aspergillus sergii TaxID=1034303 RepID=A0A5N6X217_9EURO|nr:hypothetical protein BDV39DRAFT_193889 [Aspergillus sergii]
MRHSTRAVKSNNDSDSGTDVSDIFSGNRNNNSSDSTSKANSGNDSSDDSDADSILDDGEAQEFSAEHCLEEAECFDILRLRQKRYSPQYWECFCRDSKYDPVERFYWLADSEKTVRFLKAFLFWRCDRRQGKKGRLSKNITVLTIIVEEKKLRLGCRPKATIYIKDVAEFARVLLSTMEITFEYGWLRVQVLLYCQLAAIPESRPGTLLNLRYRDLLLTLIWDPEGGCPRLFIYLTPEFTKIFLDKKEVVKITFDLPLVLSPYVFLLGMLFYIKVFKSFSTNGPMLDSLKNLYTVGVLGDLGQQELKLKDEILDQFIIKPYRLRYGAAKAFNDSLDINELVGIHVDAQAIVRGLPAAKQLLRFAASMSRSIDPRRLYKLDNTSCVNEDPCVAFLKKYYQLAFKTAKKAFKQTFGYRNKWQRQYNRLIRENLERYKNEQPVINVEWQLAGRLVDEEEYERRISAINVVVAFCDMQEGYPTRQPNANKKCRAPDTLPSTSTRRQGSPSTICFLCVANSKIPVMERLRVSSTPGSLTQHFIDKYIKRFLKNARVRCNVCNEDLLHKSALINHAEEVHGIVSRRPLSALGPI